MWAQPDHLLEFPKFVESYEEERTTELVVQGLLSAHYKISPKMDSLLPVQINTDSLEQKQGSLLRLFCLLQ